MKTMKTKGKLWALAAVAIILAGCSSPTNRDDPIVIASAEITVTAPVAGGVQLATATASEGANFTVGEVTWYPERERYFEHESEYLATVTLTAGTGHTFTGGLTTATINGQAAEVIENTGATATLTLEFPETAAPGAGPTVIANAEITLTAPVTGETPVTMATVAPGANFTAGVVTWNPAHSPFEGETEYTATVTLTANAGHSFTGGLTTATINGQAVTVSNNTGATVTLARTFAETEPGTGIEPELVLAAWQFGTAEGDGPANNPLVSASIEDGNASRPSSGQQAETARLRFWVSPGGELTQRALNAASSGVNVRDATGEANGGLDGLANNAWWQTEISTTDRTDIAVTWRMRSTNTAPRDWRLQYRVGDTGTWNNVGGTIVLSPPTTPANTLNEPEQGRFLPTSAEGHERLYLRWLMTSNVSAAGGTVLSGGTHQINDLVIRANAEPLDNEDDPPPQPGTFTIAWTGFTNPLLADTVSITKDAGVISINAPDGAFTSIQWLNGNLVEIGTGATLDLDEFPPLVTLRVRTVGSNRTYGIVFDTVTGTVF